MFGHTIRVIISENYTVSPVITTTQPIASNIKMNLINLSSCTRLLVSLMVVALIISLALPDGFNSGWKNVEAGGKGKGKGKGGNIIISTSGGGGGGGYSYPIPIPIPIHCDGGKSFWRRRRR